MTVSIKISEENYKRLSALSGELRKRLERPVSINEAITHLCAKRPLREFTGGWILRDEELKQIKKDLKKGWGSWGRGSV